jgi:hypothetical protein
MHNFLVEAPASGAGGVHGPPSAADGVHGPASPAGGATDLFAVFGLPAHLGG